MVEASVITLPLAFVAGFLSFVSPCVLPLVPAYIGYLTGQATTTAQAALATAGAEGSSGGEAISPSRWTVVMHGLAFVIGFTVIFVMLGLTAGALGNIQLAIIRNTDIIAWVGGALIIVLGLHTMDVIRIPFLYADTRKQEQPKNELGYAGSFIMGITFSAGWSPCIGPILGTILGLGAVSGSVGRAATLLGAYSLGLGIPFLATAFMMDRATGMMAGMRKHMKTFKIVSGVLMIIVGVMVMTGSVQRLAGSLAQFSDLTIMIDEWLVTTFGQ